MLRRNLLAVTSALFVSTFTAGALAQQPADPAQQQPPAAGLPQIPGLGQLPLPVPIPGQQPQQQGQMPGQAPQQPGYAPGYNPGYAPGYAPPQQQPGYVPQGRPLRSGLEIGYLYGAAVTYGAGLGIWIDAEAKIKDPGVNLIFPALLGVAAPIGVYLADYYTKGLPEGLPAAIATGMLLGAGEGIAIWSMHEAALKWGVAANDHWGFRAFARAEVAGGLLGGAAGGLFYYLLKPTPKKTMLVASGAAWGSMIGMAFGIGASNCNLNPAPPDSYVNNTLGDNLITPPGYNIRTPECNGEAGSRAKLAMGGLIGFNVGMGAAIATIIGWTPSWNQLGWMWLGFGVGAAISTPVYAFYATGDRDPRRGLIFQGVAATLGLIGGAFIGKPDRPGAIVENEQKPMRFGKILGGGLMPVEGGVGGQVQGVLW